MKKFRKYDGVETIWLKDTQSNIFGVCLNETPMIKNDFNYSARCIAVCYVVISEKVDNLVNKGTFYNLLGSFTRFRQNRLYPR